MIYIVTEDKKSGYLFWVWFSRLIFKNKIKVLTGISVLGVTHVIKNLKLKKEDVLIVSIDVVEGINIKEWREVILRENIIKKENLIFTDFYCIEEVFISSPKLLEWCQINEEYVDDLKRIQNSIWTNEDYYSNTTGNLEEYKLKAKNPNKEKMLAFLLNRATKGTPFSHENKGLSPCYYKDCCYINDINEGNIMCNIKDLFELMTGEEKIREFAESSVLTRSSDFAYLESLAKEIDFEVKIPVIFLLEENGYTPKTMDETYFKLSKILKAINKKIKRKNLKIPFIKAYIYGQDFYEQVYNFQPYPDSDKPIINEELQDLLDLLDLNLDGYELVSNIKKSTGGIKSF